MSKKRKCLCLRRDELPDRIAKLLRRHPSKVSINGNVVNAISGRPFDSDDLVAIVQYDGRHFFVRSQQLSRVLGLRLGMRLVSHDQAPRQLLALYHSLLTNTVSSPRFPRKILIRLGTNKRREKVGAGQTGRSPLRAW